jgi:hypothetical protein
MGTVSVLGVSHCFSNRWKTGPFMVDSLRQFNPFDGGKEKAGRYLSADLA